MESGVIRKTAQVLLLVIVLSVTTVYTQEDLIFACTYDDFQCLNGKCIGRSSFCDGTDDCGDDSDEMHCEYPTAFQTCPSEWTACYNRCIPDYWLCDGVEDCKGGFDERTCRSGIRSIGGVVDTERNLTQYLLATRSRLSRSINKWGPEITRVAVALFLNNEEFFTPGNGTGEEIAYELSLKLLSKLALKKRIPTKDLSLFINALTVACIDPKDFFGINLVSELRKRVDSSNHTNPFSILTLCIAKDTITFEDVSKLQQHYDAHFRPVWTDAQAMVVMALSCISSRPDFDFDERILDKMVTELKKRQCKNGTIDNLKTTVLVAQALLAAGDYRNYFDINSAIKYIVQVVRRAYPSTQDIYYILPIFNYKSLNNITSDHCSTPIKTDLEVISDLREYPDERVSIRVSIIVGDSKDFSRKWIVKVSSNYSFYQVLESIGTLEPAYKVQYSFSEGKPYVVGVAKFQDDIEDESFWFIFTKPLSSTENPKLIEKSPVDIQVKESEELILWYKSGFWADAQEN